MKIDKRERDTYHLSSTKAGETSATSPQLEPEIDGET